MKKTFILFFLLFFFLSSFKPKKVEAITDDNCSIYGVQLVQGLETLSENDSHRVVLNFPSTAGLDPNLRYKVVSRSTKSWTAIADLSQSPLAPIVDGQLDVKFKEKDSVSATDYAVRFLFLKKEGSNKALCYLGEYQARMRAVKKCEILEISQTRDVGGTTETCYIGNNGCLEEDTSIEIKIRLIKDGRPYDNKYVSVALIPGDDDTGKTNMIGVVNTTHEGLKKGPHRIEVQSHVAWDNFCNIDEAFTIEPYCHESRCNKDPADPIPSGDLYNPFKICEQINIAKNPKAHKDCTDCIGEGKTPAGIWTAIGCIPIDPTNSDQIIQILIKLGLGMGGGITLIMILVASFQLSVSQGDPKQTNEAKDKITAAIIGLLFIIFSITILQFIGVKILQIPGFGE